MRKRLVLLAACALIGSAAASPSLPRAVVADPPRDVQHPARNQQVLILSGGQGINARLLLAAGTGAKPTMLLLHGLPGNEQNGDLAQAVRRAGWNVLTMHYRGAWGSPGRFSIGGAAQDVEAAMAFLHRDDTAQRYGIDPQRIVIAGHSMGGFLATRYAATHDVAGVVLLDPWNAGAFGKDTLAAPETRSDRIADLGDDFGNALAGTDAATLVAEVERNARDWDLRDLAPKLAGKPVLVVAAEQGLAKQIAPLTAALRSGDAKHVQAVTLATDHSFADQRIALATITVNWLEDLFPRAVVKKGKR